jgi:hypothetical protein
MRRNSSFKPHQNKLSIHVLVTQILDTKVKIRILLKDNYVLITKKKFTNNFDFPYKFQLEIIYVSVGLKSKESRNLNFIFL